MLTWLTGFTLAPWLAVAGTLAIAAPIIIHLLNKRKFKIVDWAAMDFLLDADKKNRRRVRLENFLLLFLRCLAIFLLGLLLAQPFLSNEFSKNILGSAAFEYLVVLDDSLSMQVQTGNQTPFDQAKERLVKLLREFAENRSGDSFTLVLTSQPDQRQFNGVRIEKDSVKEITDAIEALEPTDRAADLPKVLANIEQEVKGLPKDINRMLYVITDLRKRDWHKEPGTPDSTDPAKIVSNIAKSFTGAFILDVGGEDQRNLMITDIKPEGVLVAGVASRFQVTVTNYGTAEVRDVVVKFKAGDALPIEAPIESIKGGESATVPFSFTFSGAVATTKEEDEDKRPLDPVRVAVEIATRGAEEDRLLADSSAYFPARIVRGIPTLIVDGDPSSNEETSESYYLLKALEPPGEMLAGIDADVILESEMETTSLAKYQVIFLCNVYQFSEKVRKDLEAWVARGGGLVIMPGDQVAERVFNDVYYKDGAGLSPLKLESILGDEQEEKWVQFRVQNTGHPVLALFEGQNNPLLEMTKVFRWWGTSADKNQIGKNVAVIARFNDPENSVAIAEKKFGDGNVFMTTIPADADWHIWPIFGTYLSSMEELVRHMAGDVAGSGSLRVGESLTQSIDLTDYKTDAELKLPRDKKVNLQAREPGSENTKPADSGDKKAEDKDDAPAKNEEKTDAGEKKEGAQTRWQIAYEDTGKRGFYELLLARNDGYDEKVLFAANADPTEGDLSRADMRDLRDRIGDAPVKISSTSNVSELTAAGAQQQLWKYLLLIAVIVLCGEQLLAWAFGLKR
jgi:hypothetical protein